MRIRQSVFDVPIQDEVELAQQAQVLLKEMSSLPTKSQILELTQTHSPDIATRCFFDSLRRSEKHGPIISEIEHQSVTPNKSLKDICLYIIPGMFYKEHPELGTNGELVKTVAEKFNIEVKIINTASVGTIVENSKILAQELSKKRHSKVWLLSISKGSCDVQRFLQSQRGENKITGWIDIAGVHKGVPFIDKAFDSVLSRINLRLISVFFGINYSVFKELRCSETHWQNRHWPSDLEAIHVVPVPLKSHVHNTILRRYKQTLSHGPNDGFIPLTDVLEMPGAVYPIWGHDHYLRAPCLSELLHKLFNYIKTR